MMAANSSAPTGEETVGRRRGGLAGRLPELDLSLLDLADRLLDRGVVLAGDATISVAGVDLVFLGLNAVLSSVETLERAGRTLGPGGLAAGPVGRRNGGPGSAGGGPLRSEGGEVSLEGDRHSIEDAGAASARSGASGIGLLQGAEREIERVQGVLPERVDVDPEGVERALAKLVLTLVEFIRQLLERQAVRRMDGGGLTEEQVERMGLALERLEAKMAELCRVFGLDPNELNIDLGPLGDLL
jgi:hypothetical protein